MKGTIEKIFDTNQVSTSFKKREFVLKYADNPQYPEIIKMEFSQDKCNALDDFKVGDYVEVKFNIRGRMWTNPKKEEVYFVTLQAWQMDVVEQPGDISPEKETNDSEESSDDVPPWMK